ncbi:DoxX family protein [Streptomyces sp. RKCA744]|uniref:DoxX family protein n=1 Tax=Streptomyces sp. RKCA744 TaxID=2959340 RepID=UPI00209DD00A|nr:DoxX family membrane protein [Streptomyces sp. RKCA744]MCO8308487.1 DoxX family membrane protein [Streptomyces sp. RKCA744]
MPSPRAGRTRGFDDEPQLTMAKVPCDPARVAVNAPSFRVQLSAPVVSSALADTARLARVPAGRRRPPVVWSGRTRPGGDTAATRLLQAVRYSHEGLTDSPVDGFSEGLSDGPGRARSGEGAEDVGATQVLPRIAFDDDAPTVIGPRSPRTETVPRPGGRRRPGADGPGEADAAGAASAVARAAGAERRGASSGPGRGAVGGDGYGSEARRAALPRPRRHSESVRHAYYPGRRMNLGVVLLPLRIFLGFISVYGGMGKLSDPVYFDGGERGSMVTWLRTLHPWPIAEPLRDLALEHPVGAGLTVAFLQIVVGVLTVLGLWQRLAASVGALLSAALILTVSWRTVPVYDAPDIIYLAAWSPLIIAGAPVYSADARLAGEAWRRLGPRSELWQLRRRVLRRGSVMAMVVAGLTLLMGSMLGAAVRSSEVVKGPEPSDLPTNNLPGSPLPSTSVESPRGGSRGPLGAGGSAGARSPRERLLHRPEPSASASGSATGGPSAPEASSGTSGTSGRPSGTSRTRPGLGTTPRSPRRPVAPTATAGPPSPGGAGGSMSAGGPEGGPPEDNTYGSPDPAGEEAALGGLLG